MNLCELDYYNVLNVPRSASKDDIAIAYRKLAIKLCPFRDAAHQRDFIPNSQGSIQTHMSPLPLNRQWAYINMAYDILGNELHRHIYDRLGEAGLLQGIVLPNGYFPPYKYHGDHMKVYHEVFGSYSPYANIIDTIVGESPPLYNSKGYGIGVKTKDEAVVKTIALELEEVYNGCIKLMHVIRQEFVDPEETKLEKKKKTLTLNIPAGVTPGTSFCFKEEGDRHPTKIPADIKFLVEEKPHPYFKRVNQHDLAYTHKISLAEAMVGFKFVIETLDKRKLTISITDVVTPGYVKLIPGEGMPVCISEDVMDKFKKTAVDKRFGNLIIKFTVVFPQYLTPAMKKLTRTFFKDFHELENEG